MTGPSIYSVLDAPRAPIYKAVAWLLHPLLGVLAVSCMKVQAATAWLAQRRSHCEADSASAHVRAEAFLRTTQQSPGAVHAMGMAQPLRDRWRARQDEVLAAEAAAQRGTARWNAVSRFVRHLQQSLALAAGALLVVQGHLTAGAMIAATLLVARR